MSEQNTVMKRKASFKSRLFEDMAQGLQNGCKDAWSGGCQTPQPLGMKSRSFSASFDTDADSSASGYHGRARQTQLQEQSNEIEKKGLASLKKTGCAGVVLLVFGALHWANQNPLTSKATCLDSVGYSGTWLGAAGYRSLQWWANPDFDGYVFQHLAGNVSSWEAPHGCHVPKVGTHIKNDALQNISACYYEAFDKLQHQLNSMLCDAFPPQVQSKQCNNFRWASLVTLIVVLLWSSFKLKMLPAQEWWSERFFKWIDFKPKFNWVARTVFWLAVVAAAAFMVPGPAMFFSIQGACALLEHEQHDFLRRLQTAAVVSLYEREFKCLLFCRSPIPREVVSFLSNRIVQSLLLVPIGKFTWTAWHKASSKWRVAQALANGKRDCVNFSLNIMQGQRLIWRTLCEIREDELISNAVLHESTTNAAACTTSEYPFLHTLEQASDLNLLVLNRISQLVGAYQYFGMDGTDDQQVKLHDYCFGVTCENYNDHGDRKLQHEKKLRVMIIKKDVLEKITKKQIDHIPEGGDEEKKLKFEVASGKGNNRWRTLQAMAACFAEEELLPGTNSVWTMQVPVRG